MTQSTEPVSTEAPAKAAAKRGRGASNEKQHEILLLLETGKERVNAQLENILAKAKEIIEAGNLSPEVLSLAKQINALGPEHRDFVINQTKTQISFLNKK